MEPTTQESDFIYHFPIDLEPIGFELILIISIGFNIKNQEFSGFVTSLPNIYIYIFQIYIYIYYILCIYYIYISYSLCCYGRRKWIIDYIMQYRQRGIDLWILLNQIKLFLYKHFSIPFGDKSIGKLYLISVCVSHWRTYHYLLSLSTRIQVFWRTISLSKYLYRCINLLNFHLNKASRYGMEIFFSAVLECHTSCDVRGVSGGS